MTHKTEQAARCWWCGECDHLSRPFDVTLHTNNCDVIRHIHCIQDRERLFPNLGNDAKLELRRRTLIEKINQIDRGRHTPPSVIHDRDRSLLELWEMGHSYRKIEEMTGLSKATVSHGIPAARRRP